MNYAEQVNNTIEELKAMPHGEIERWKEKARDTYNGLMKLAESGGAGECDMNNLRIAARVNLGKNVIYDSQDEWYEKREKLIEAITDAILNKRDSITWIRLLTANLADPETKAVVEKLHLRHINQFLFPALEAEADIDPSARLMRWYVAMLDKGAHAEDKAFNRLAYFYLWYGGWECDEERAKEYFQAMERRGIARRNPYRGTFGEHGHEEMIIKLLNGELDEDRFHLLVKYTGEQAHCIEENGLIGNIEIMYNDEIGNVRWAWIEDHNGRDLRETIQRLYDIAQYGLNGENLSRMDEMLKKYGNALKALMEKASQNPDQEHFRKGVILMLALLFNYDNWLLRIIDLEACDGEMLRESKKPEGSGASEKREESYYKCMKDWLTRVQPFCGGTIRIGDELMVMNSLYENLINYNVRMGNNEEFLKLLEEHVYTTDGMATLVEMGAEIGTEYYGAPYITHNSIALLKKYADKGGCAKAEKLIGDIAETEKKLPNHSFQFEWNGTDRRRTLQNKYAFLLKEIARDLPLEDEMIFKSEDLCQEYYYRGEYRKALEECDADSERRRQLLAYLDSGKLPEEAESRGATIAEHRNRSETGSRKLSTYGGCMTATKMTPQEFRYYAMDMDKMAERFYEDWSGDRREVYPQETYSLKHVFRPAPATSRGEYIRHTYNNPEGRDWFGRTAEEWEESINNLTQGGYSAAPATNDNVTD